MLFEITKPITKKSPAQYQSFPFSRNTHVQTLTRIKSYSEFWFLGASRGGYAFIFRAVAGSTRRETHVEQKHKLAVVSQLPDRRSWFVNPPAVGKETNGNVSRKHKIYQTTALAPFVPKINENHIFLIIWRIWFYCSSSTTGIDLSWIARYPPSPSSALCWWRKVRIHTTQTQIQYQRQK